MVVLNIGTKMLKERRFSDDTEYEYEEAYPLRRKMEFLVKKING